MRYGFVLPGGSSTQQLDLATVAEQSGWDGLFVYETSYAVEPWSLLAAMAQRTERIRLGTMLTPVPWRRPWKLASQVVTLDQLSNGRAILASGTDRVKPWADAGCTWWLETRWMLQGSPAEQLDQVRARVAAGPPRFSE